MYDELSCQESVNGKLSGNVGYVFFMHMMLDGNISPNIGSNPTDAIKNFELIFGTNEFLENSRVMKQLRSTRAMVDKLEHNTVVYDRNVDYCKKIDKIDVNDMRDVLSDFSLRMLDSYFSEYNMCVDKVNDDVEKYNNIHDHVEKYRMKLSLRMRCIVLLYIANVVKSVFMVIRCIENDKEIMLPFFWYVIRDFSYSGHAVCLGVKKVGKKNNRGNMKGGGYDSDNGSKHGSDNGSEYGSDNRSDNGSDNGSENGSEYEGENRSEYGSNYEGEYESDDGSEYESENDSEYESEHESDDGSEYEFDYGLNDADDVYDNDVYNVVLNNSGMGMQYHPYKVNDDKEIEPQCLMNFGTVDIVTLFRTLMCCLSCGVIDKNRDIFEDIFEIENGEVEELVESLEKYCVKFIDTEKFYEEMRKIYHVENFDGFYNERYFFGKQLSGSCTYYSIYYYMRYLFARDNYRNLVIFDTVYDVVKIKECLRRFKLLKNDYNKNNYATDVEMNLVELVRNAVMKYDDPDVQRRLEKSWRYVVDDVADIVYEIKKICDYIEKNYEKGVSYDYKLKCNKHNKNMERRLLVDRGTDKIVDIEGAYVLMDRVDCVYDYVLSLLELLQIVSYNVYVLEKNYNKIYSEIMMKLCVERIVKHIVNTNKSKGVDFYVIVKSEDTKVRDIKSFLLHCNLFVSAICKFVKVYNIELVLAVFANMVVKSIKSDTVVKLTNFVPNAQKYANDSFYTTMKSGMFVNGVDLGEIRKYNNYYAMKEAGNNLEFIDAWKNVSSEYGKYLYQLINIKGVYRGAFKEMIGSQIDDKHDYKYVAESYRKYDNEVVIVEKGVPVYVMYVGVIFIKFEDKNVEYVRGITSYDMSKEKMLYSEILLAGKYVIRSECCKIVKCEDHMNNYVLEIKKNDVDKFGEIEDEKMCKIYFYDRKLVYDVVMKTDKNNIKFLKSDCYTDNKLLVNVIEDGYDYHEYKHVVGNMTCSLSKMFQDRTICDSVYNLKIVVDNYVNNVANLNVVMKKYTMGYMNVFSLSNNESEYIVCCKEYDSDADGSTSQVGGTIMLYEMYNVLRDIDLLRLKGDDMMRVFDVLDKEIAFLLLRECLTVYYMFEESYEIDKCAVKKFLEGCISYYKIKYGEEKHIIYMVSALYYFVDDECISSYNYLLRYVDGYCSKNSKYDDIGKHNINMLMCMYYVHGKNCGKLNKFMKCFVVFENMLNSKYPGVKFEEDKVNKLYTNNELGTFLDNNDVTNSIFKCVRDKFLYKKRQNGDVYDVVQYADDKYAKSSIVYERRKNPHRLTGEIVDDSHIYKMFNGVKYMLVKDDDYESIEGKCGLLNGIYGVVTDDMLIWSYQNDYYIEYAIEFPNICDENGNYLVLFMDGKCVRYRDYTLGTEKFLHNRYVCGIDNAYVLCKDNEYKILLINGKISKILKDIKKVYLSCYVNDKDKAKDDDNKNDNIVNVQMLENKFYVIDVHISGLFLSFSCVGAFYSYFMYANICQKSDIIVMLYSLCLPYIDNEHVKKMLYSPNTPYNYYIAYKYFILCEGETIVYYDDDDKRYDIFLKDRAKYYPKKYQLKDRNVIKYDDAMGVEGEQIDFDNSGVKKLLSFLRDNDYVRDNVYDVPSLSSDNEIIVSLDSFLKVPNKENDEGKEVFFNCVLNKDKIIENQEKIIEFIKANVGSMENHMGEIYDNIHSLITEYKSDYDYACIIKNNPWLFYELLILSKTFDLYKSVDKVVSGIENDNFCNEVMFLTSVLDDYYVCKELRKGHVVLFEVMFNSLIRKQQYALYESIVKEVDMIDMGGKYNIRHMLMGKGKTSVVTPLLLFNYLFGSDKINNIVIVLPNHLIDQTYNMLVKNYVPVMDGVCVKKVIVKRNSNNKDVRSYFSTYDSNGNGGIYMRRKNVIITNMSSLQSIILRKCEMSLNRMPFDRDDTLFIFDEIDTLSEPLSNELNHPNVAMDHDMYFDFIVETVFVLSKYLYENKYIGDMNSDIIKSKEKRDNAINLCKFDDVIKKYKNLNGDVVKYLLNNIRKKFDTVLQRMYNKNYGFDMTNGVNVYIAVPYNGVNSPVSGSEFSDLYVKMAFTCLSYLHENNLRKCDIAKIKSYIVDKHIENCGDNKVFKTDEIVVATKIGTIDKIDIISIRNFDLNKHYDSNMLYVYLKNIVFKDYIKQYKTQYNCSFIDVAGNDFGKYKIGFSGTVGDIHKDILKVSDSDDKYIFNDIFEDKITMGSIYSAFLGTTQKKNNKPKISKIVFDDNKMNVKGEQYKDYELDYMIDILREGKYDTLIDAGAVLRNYTALQVINKVRKVICNYKSYVYIDSDGKEVRVSNESVNNGVNDKIVGENKEVGKNEEVGKNKEVGKNEEVKVMKEMFIYYDQIHTVGTDVRNQPYEMKGLVTINYFNRFTDISQGMFRLRKLNYGHVIDFVTVNIDIEFKDQLSLLLYLKKKDVEYVNSSKPLAALQQLKYLQRRKTNNYEEPVYYDLDTKYVNYQGDKHGKFISDNFCLKVNGVLSDLCEIARNIKDEDTRIQEQEQEQTVNNIQENIALVNAINLYDDYVIKKQDIDYKTPLSRYINVDGYKSYFVVGTKNNKAGMLFSECLYKNGIYLSKYIFCGKFDMLGNMKDVVQQNTIDMYNYYFITSLDGSGYCNDILIIKGIEFVAINKYLTDNNIERIIIVNKKGETVYPKNKNVVLKFNEKMSYAMYLIGSKRLIDTIVAAKMIFKNQKSFEDIGEFKKVLDYHLLTTAGSNVVVNIAIIHYIIKSINGGNKNVKNDALDREKEKYKDCLYKFAMLDKVNNIQDYDSMIIHIMVMMQKKLNKNSKDINAKDAQDIFGKIFGVKNVSLLFVNSLLEKYNGVINAKNVKGVNVIKGGYTNSYYGDYVKYKEHYELINN